MLSLVVADLAVSQARASLLLFDPIPLLQVLLQPLLTFMRLLFDLSRFLKPLLASLNPARRWAESQNHGNRQKENEPPHP